MKNNKVVVVSEEKKPYDKQYVQQLRQQARAAVAAITEKPTLESLYKSVDACWDMPSFVKQTNFANKDQHYAYITEYYHSVIEKMTVEEYKRLVLSDLMNRLDAAEALLSSEKILSAAKAHKEQEDKLTAQYDEQIADLKERNDKLMGDLFKND